MYNAEEMKSYLRNADKMIDVLNEEILISDSTKRFYFSDEHVNLYYSHPKFIFDIGTSFDNKYDYYFKDIKTGKELFADDKDMNLLSKDPAILNIKKILNKTRKKSNE